MRASSTNRATWFALAALVAAIAFVPDAAARVIHVKWDATGMKDGTSWADAFVFLQDALAQASSDDEIRVAAGIYSPDQGAGQTPGDRNAMFALRGGVSLYGGFEGTETTLEQRAGLFTQTVLSGDLARNDTPSFGDNAENSYHVVAARDLSGAVLIDGFAIQSGNANGDGGLYGPYDGQAFGGGMQVVRSSPVIRNCTFRWNDARYGGGAILAWDGSSPLLSRCDLVSNRSGYFGGGAFVAGPQTTAHWNECRFLGNTAQEGGAAMSGGTLQTTYTNCLFSGNTAQRAGGGLHITGGSPAFVNCTITDNSHNQRYGAGVFVYHSSPTFTNCILWHNRDTNGTDALAQIHNANPPINFPAIRYSCVEGGWTGAGGVSNLSLDPLFVDPDGSDGLIGTSDDDLTLLDSSPVIDAGNNAAVPPGVTIDLGGSPRFFDGPAVDIGVGSPPIVDMGVFENQQSPWVLIAGAPLHVPPGGTRIFATRLVEPPLSPVMVMTTWVAGDPDIAVVQGAALSFDAANFDQWQTVTLAAAADGDHVIGTATFEVRAATFAVVTLFATEIETGDVNCDGSIDFFDIDPFLLALFDPSSYPLMYPDCDLLLADFDLSGAVEMSDIDPFLHALFGQ